MDAVRWCLGEQSARELRGGSAQDVIYAGPRRSGGMAEVRLTFEGTDGELPDGADSLVAARRLYRSGESEYLLDGQRVRLRDLTDALRAMGIDDPEHVVVNQGMADALLAASPMDRRALLEHAAGLSGYRVRRDEARQKLAVTRRNVDTIETLLAEMEPRLRVLRRQARAVAERDDARLRLTDALRRWYASQWRALEATLVGLDEEIGGRQTERSEVSRRVADLEGSAEAFLAQERAWRERLAGAVEAVHAAEREHERGLHALHSAVQRRDALRERVRGAEGRLARLSAEREAAAARLSDAEKAAGELRERQGPIEIQLREGSQEEERLQSAYREAEQRRRAREAEFRRARERSSAARREHDAAVARVEDRGAQLEAATAQERELEERTRELQEKMGIARGQEREAERVAESAISELAAREARERAQRTAVERVEALRTRIRRALADVERRAPAATRETLALEAQLGGSLLTELRVAEEWSDAVAAALGAWGPGEGGFQGVDIEGFLAWRAGLSNEGDAAFLWADLVTESAEPLGLVRGHGVGSQAGSGATEGCRYTGVALQRDDEFEGGRDGTAAGGRDAAGFAGFRGLTPLHGAILVESEEEAERVWERVRGRQAHVVGAPPICVVTREGVRIWAPGRDHGSEGSAGRYLRARNERDRLHVRLVELRKRNAWVDERRSGMSEDLRHLQHIVEEGRRQLRNARNEVARQTADVEALEHRAAGLLKEAERLALRRVALTEAIEVERMATARLEHAAEVAERDLHAVANPEGESDVETLRSALEEAARRRRQIAHEREVISAQVAGQAAAADAARRECSRLESEILGLRRSLESSQRDLAELDGEIEPLEGAVQMAADRLAASKAEEADVRQSRPVGEPSADELREARARLSKVVPAHERLLAQRESALVQRERLIEAVCGDLDMEAEALGEAPEIVPAENEIQRLRRAATQYADVDVSVIGEARELEERYTHLGTHAGDLRAAADNLQEIMEAADREMRGRFGAALEAVNGEFGRVFTVMLRGGEARLTEEPDGGIEIVAQLPGKRARSSAAYSGGERSLVATSLLFGVLKIRPAPFCVLDEVDAALDESNVDRYLAALRDISARTQAIVVTHNRATMAAADVLYGTTMDEEGVSRLLSLRLEAYGAAG